MNIMINYFVKISKKQKDKLIIRDEKRHDDEQA